MSSNVRTGRESAMALQRPNPVFSGQLGGRAGSVSARSTCLRESQKNFAAALLDPNMPVPRGLVGPDREPSETRFNVYRNNVVAGLVETLKAAFPAACRIVGDEFFAGMARLYVALEPPKSPTMFNYGATFPYFIESFEPAKSVPYLGDVARLERAWVEAYHAAEAAPTDPATLASIEPGSLPRVRFTLHPSVRVIRSSFPAVCIWQMNIDGGVPAAVDIFGGGENALVIRPVAEVEVRRVPAGAAAFIQGLVAGASVAGAAMLAFDESPDFQLADALGELFAINAIVEWTLQDDSDFTPIAGYL